MHRGFAIGADGQRHPKLTMVFAEQGADWVPDLLQLLDFMYETYFAHEQKRLSLKPSEYFRRQLRLVLFDQYAP